MITPLQTALSRIEMLGAISDSPDHLVRTFLSLANFQAAEMISSWMEDLGMTVSHTVDGTVRGVFGGADAPPLLLGSHYDTVIDAGKYDGPLGIIAALAALEQTGPLPFPVHVLAFPDEEGARFQTTYLGSRGIMGPLDDDTLDARDADGISIREALERDGRHAGSTEILYRPGDCRGYVELHIEQGRVLESSDLPACIVSSIAGQSRLTVTLTGRTDHAGTTPMPLRRDALAGAAACILAAEEMAKSQEPLLITVGKIRVHPGATNSVPQSAEFSVDLRHPEDPQRWKALADLEAEFRKVSSARGLQLRWQMVQENNATPCDPALTAALLDSLHAVTGSRMLLASGAGHDGVAIAKICPIAMVFIRCRDGLSHHPDEFASPEDIATGIEILTRFLEQA